MDEFAPSALGTKSHWDAHYQTELCNLEELGDEGDIWFGKSSERRIINYLESSNAAFSSRILDVGCGNGHLCLELAFKGFSNVVGVDYSENSIALSNKLLKDAVVQHPVIFKCLDILSNDSITKLISNETGGHLFDILIDKGTFDAISLSTDDEDSSSSIRSRKVYIEHAHRLLDADGSGLCIITSCNWVAEELREQFEKDRLFFLVCELPALKTFTFGGFKGSDTVCVVFKRL